MISAVNVCAAQAGVAVGARLTDARAALPSLICRAAEPREDDIALLRLARWAGRYGPNRNIEGGDGLWIEITGVAHLFGGEEELLDDLVQRLSHLGVPSRIGLARTFGAAHALARFGMTETGTWALAPDGTDRAVLASFPVESLRFDEKTVVLLKRLGLRRVGQLYDVPRDSLARRFRSKDVAGEVLTRLDQMLGLKQEPCVPLAEPPVLSVRRVFSEPLISPDAIEHLAAALCEELCAVLAEKGRGARAVRLSLYRADGSVADVDIALRAATREGKHIFLLLKEKFGAIDAGFGVDLMVLDCVRAGRLKDVQGGFSEDGGAGDYDPGPLIDRLSNRLGVNVVTALAPRASHIPERSQARVPAMMVASPSPRAFPVRGEGVKYEPPWPYGPYGKSPRRPPFVFERPEPISVIAEVPDGPPVRFVWRRLERRVVRAEGPERIAPEWWRAIGLGENQKRPRPRDYYEVEDETGARYWIFRHGLYGGAEVESEEDEPPRWYMHGLFA